MTRVRSACPECGDRQPKEVLVERRHNTATWLVFSLLSCGLGLFTYPLFTRKVDTRYCARCHSTYED